MSKADKRGDHGDGDANADLLAEARQRDRDELAYRPGTVELRRLVERRVDLAIPASSNTVQSPEQHPRTDHAHRGQCCPEVTEPGSGHAAQANGLERLVDNAR